MIEHLPSVLEALGSSPEPQRKEGRREEIPQTKTFVSHISVKGKEIVDIIDRLCALLAHSLQILVWNGIPHLIRFFCSISSF